MAFFAALNALSGMPRIFFRMNVDRPRAIETVVEVLLNVVDAGHMPPVGRWLMGQVADDEAIQP